MKKFEIFAALLIIMSVSPESYADTEKIHLEEFCGTMDFYNESIYYAKNFPLGENDIKISKIAIQESIGNIKNLWVKDYYYGNNSWRQIPAVLVNVTNISYIYVELNEPNNKSVWYNGSNNGYITQDDADSIAEEFQKIYYKDRLYFGEERPVGVDGDSHITILLLDIGGDYANNWNGSGHIKGPYGYYHSADEYSNTTQFCSWCIYSNQRKILYIDTYPQIETGNRTSRIPDRNHSNSYYQEGLNWSSFNAIAHEFQHMIHWYHDPNEDSWINEGISEYAGFINGYGNHEFNVQAFSKNPEDSLTTWDGALADYGAAYLFILYLSENYGGNSTIKNLVNNTKNGIDGINDTLKITGYNDTFQSIFPNWAIANILSNYSNLSISMNYTKISSYPANSTGSIEIWASSYINFSNGNGSNLNISFSGFGNSSFNISLIKGQNNSKTIEGIPLIGNIGSGIINGLGSLYSYVIMVITSSTGGNYSYLAEYSSVVTTTTTSTTTTTTSLPLQMQNNTFKMAFILVGKNSSELTSERTSKLKTIKNSFSDKFYEATSNLGYMNTSYDVVTMVDNNGVLVISNYAEIDEITKKFYEIHPDEFDFISIYTAFETSAYQSHIIVNNDIKGIGYSITSDSGTYGTKGRLKGVNHMGFIDMYDENDLTTYNGLLHETGHQWCCFVGDNFNRGIGNPRLEIIQDSIHFYTGLESPFITGTPMGANYWVFNDDNKTYRDETNANLGIPKYHPFQLYFMGLLPKSDVGYSKEYKIYDAGIPPNYNSINATLYKEISINDIIGIEGERQVVGVTCIVKGDKDCNGLVDDFELLDYINQWAKGIVGDFDLLEAIDNWAKG